jgi:P-type Cu2+ transporter
VVERVVSTLVVACPHALGLAIPLVIAISTTLGARSGLLVRDRRGLEEARNLDAVVFDKTGTLTLGEHRVVSMEDGGGPSSRTRRCAWPRRWSATPSTRSPGRSSRARRSGISVPSAGGFEAIPATASRPGRGARAAGRRPEPAAQAGSTPDPALAQAAEARRERPVHRLPDRGRRTLAVFAIADAIRPESLEACGGCTRGDRGGDAHRRLAGRGRRVAGSWASTPCSPRCCRRTRRRRSRSCSGRASAWPWWATASTMRPPGHRRRRHRHRRRHRRGRGGRRRGAGAQRPARRRADRGAQPASYRKMIQNLWWAAGYNIVAIPLAAGVLAGTASCSPRPSRPSSCRPAR